MLNRPPPQSHRLLILATAVERTVLQNLNLYQSFDQKIAVPNVNKYAELKLVLSHSRVFTDPLRAIRELEELSRGSEGVEVGVGIKSILLAIDTARQDEADREGRFASTIASIKGEGGYE